MKEILLVLVLCSTSFIGKSQGKTMDDSIAWKRSAADAISVKLEATHLNRIIYSISNKNYYLATQDSLSYSEYLVIVDSSNQVSSFKRLKTSKKDTELLAHAFTLNFIRVDAEFAENYTPDGQIIVQVNKAKKTAGARVYFISKDKNDEKLIEYFLPAVSIPNPLGGKTSYYFLTKLMDEVIKEENKKIRKAIISGKASD